MTGTPLVIITGASRGIGREIFDQALEDHGDAVVVLTSRRIEDLEKVKSAIASSHHSATVHLFAQDLATWDDAAGQKFAELLQKIVDGASISGVLLFHNAGSTGDLTKKAAELSDLKDWQQYLQANFLSLVSINNAVVRVVGNKSAKKTIINITSLVAIQAFPSFTQYACGKAVREAFFRSLAVEYPDWKILNYSPGPVDTDMYHSVAKNSYDEETREEFKKKAECKDAAESVLSRKMLTPKETVTRLFHILKEDKFESGGRVDYFDKE
ncbi:unnamed protein product, partial [Mesorhabditis spiculigera]